MKSKFTTIISIVLALLTSCGDLKEETQSEKQQLRNTNTTAINYDYDNLRLRLNSEIDDSTSNIEWKWDYMNSDNGMPDTTGIDHYMSINQPTFSFNGETTLPSLSVTTYRKRIIRFSATIIFHLENDKPESIGKLLDSLTLIDILQNEKVRQSIITNHNYYLRNDDFEESVKLEFSEDEYGYDRMVYEIKKITPHNKAYSLWRVNGCQQGFRSVASFGFRGQESALKPPQAICETLGTIVKRQFTDKWQLQ